MATSNVKSPSFQQEKEPLENDTPNETDAWTPVVREKKFQQEKELSENDTPNETNARTLLVREKSFLLKPVSPFDSGEGLPYAPEGWPNPGDIWSWRVGKRINCAGYFYDRYLFPPKSLQNPSNKEVLKSKVAIERYIASNFPSTCPEEFFALFSWKVPSIKLSPTKVKTDETEKRVTEGISVQRKRKRKAQTTPSAARRPIRRSSRLVFRSVRSVNQDEGTIIDLCSMNDEMLHDSKDLTGNSVSESGQLSTSNTGLSKTENTLAASKEGFDIQTTPEKSPNETVTEHFDDYLNSLEDILVLPQTETSLSDPAKPNTLALAADMTECRNKLSTLLTMDFPSLVSSSKFSEFAILASQLHNDPSLTLDEVIKLKSVEEIPLIVEAFQEANRIIDQADRFFADLEAKKVKVTNLKKEYIELKDKVTQAEAEVDSSSLAIQEIDDQISQLQLRKAEMLSSHEGKQKRKTELTCSKAALEEFIPVIVADIQLASSEMRKWELKKQICNQRKDDILDRFNTLRGFSF
ncbi:hypothetical protein L6164_025682 [Bauhinia variegata]|uniref:Uncharacterized protein n=1 Tax=Bauhinia variegata TaxID=167791 RepID=A0ACB9M112_BAUVA|nr:hypothetical protein L6164_025682 [Bauhinia variegata]